MERYAVYTTEDFDKEVAKLSQETQRRIEKIFFQLRDNPYVGNQLIYRNLREKRLQEKRIYYVVYDDMKTVLIVAIGGKKAQQKTIDYIIASLREYRIYMERLINKNN
ncbi:MAG: type II toxin-antitoxin system RelE/ParE family toxin [archaeon]